MIQGSMLRSFRIRKMEATEGVTVSGDKTHLVIPVSFTKGKGVLKKDSEFTFVTADKVQMFENLATVEWHPDLHAYSYGSFVGTPVIGPGVSPVALRGTMAVKKEFDIRDLPWLARLWIHER